MHKYEVKYVIFHLNLYVIKKFVSGKSIFHVQEVLGSCITILSPAAVFISNSMWKSTDTHTHTHRDRQTNTPHTHTLTQQWQQ